MSEELKRCPFCGGDARLRAGTEKERCKIECELCGIDISYYDERDAIGSWNERDLRGAVREIVESVKAAWRG